MNLVPAIATDLAAISILAYFLYFRRHRRRDLLLAYTALNIGVLAVTISLSSVQVGIGLGIGLFGILSIIRLRSDQITQQEIAYYFTSLALGLLAGLNPQPIWLVPLLSILMLAIIAVVDSPLVVARSRRVVLTLDRALLDENELRVELERRLIAKVMRCETLEIDTVRDITVVDVRYRLPRAAIRTSAKVNKSRAHTPARTPQRIVPQAPAYRVPVAPNNSIGGAR